jgi:hypothetical protein
VILTGTKYKDDIVTETLDSAHLVATSPKFLMSVVAGTIEHDPMLGCQVSRCTAYPIPPDPGVDYAGWQAFNNSGAQHASYCHKCERSPDYK